MTDFKDRAWAILARFVRIYEDRFGTRWVITCGGIFMLPCARCAKRSKKLRVPSVIETCSLIAHDFALVERLLNREHLAMVAVFNLYSRRTLMVALGILRNTVEAEDVMHDVFIQLWCKPHQYNATGSLGNWLALLARRRAIDVYRRKSRLESLDDVFVMTESGVL